MSLIITVAIYCNMIFTEYNPMNFEMNSCKEAISECLFDDSPNYCLEPSNYEEIEYTYFN